MQVEIQKLSFGFYKVKILEKRDTKKKIVEGLFCWGSNHKMFLSWKSIKKVHQGEKYIQSYKC